MADIDIDTLAAGARNALTSAAQVVERSQAFPSGPYALFHHHSHCLERIHDVQNILHRMQQGRARLTDVGRREDELRRLDRETVGPASEERRAIHRELQSAVAYMRLDMESLYVFGGTLLDQWSYFTAYITGAPAPETTSFHALVERLQTADANDILLPLWAQCRHEMLWLTYQVRYYRNRFMVHVDRPWQRGSTHSVEGDDFSLFIPSPPGWLDDDRLEREVFGMLRFAPQWLQDAPDDYWERARARALLQRIFENIGSIERREDREGVSRLVNRMGVSTPSFQIVGRNLLGFITSATPLVAEVAERLPENINLGRPRSRRR